MFLKDWLRRGNGLRIYVRQPTDEPLSNRYAENMLQVLCAGRDPLLLGTRQLMLQWDGFAAEVAIGTKATVAAFTRRHFDVVVLCHTFRELERHLLKAQLSEHAPWARVVCLERPEISPCYSPEVFLRLVAAS